jgi:hypothetical protein
MVTEIGVAGMLARKKLATSKFEGAAIVSWERLISLVKVIASRDKGIGRYGILFITTSLAVVL